MERGELSHEPPEAQGPEKLTRELKAKIERGQSISENLAWAMLDGKLTREQARAVAEDGYKSRFTQLRANVERYAKEKGVQGKTQLNPMRSVQDLEAANKDWEMLHERLDLSLELAEDLGDTWDALTDKYPEAEQYRKDAAR